MEAEAGGPIIERLTRLQTQAEENRERIASLYVTLERLANDVQSSRRPQWQLYLTAMGVMLSFVTGVAAVLGFIGMAMIRPIEQGMASHQQAIQTNRNNIDALEARAEENATGIIRDRGRIEDHERWIKVLYRKVEGEDLPAR